MCKYYIFVVIENNYKNKLINCCVIETEGGEKKIIATKNTQKIKNKKKLNKNAKEIVKEL
jgi:hypothetical protein